MKVMPFKNGYRKDSKPTGHLWMGAKYHRMKLRGRNNVSVKAGFSIVKA